MLNKIIIIGRLTSDPTLIYTTNGHPTSRMTLAVDRSYKDKNGDRQTDFIPVVTWGKLAETVANYLRKGKLAAVEGSLEIRSYDKDGEKRYIAEIIAENVRFLEKIEK